MMGSDVAGHIEETRFADALSERYIAYAMSTIMSRSLPDVRDGLKPVHRRILYAMQQLKLDPSSGFKKCARVVGDVIGKFHPHGDASVYDALVRLAQDFAARYPLVEGQGNFGSIDGDGAAAMRYTESRMTEVAQYMLDSIHDDAVDFRSTYDNEDQEPIVLPGLFPNLLANGASGIAVGMATSIPPHNAAEIYRAAQSLIKNPNLNHEALLNYIPGPDFPTGGILVEERDAVLRAYETGRGSFRIRARWEIERGKSGSWVIIVTEIPYQVQKSKLIEQIARLMEEKKLPLLADIRDESTTDIRLILEPKTRNCDPELLMETLFKFSLLESRFSLNMNVLNKDAVPAVLSLKEVISSWLQHLHDVLVRRSQHRLQNILKRLEILEGFLAVYLNIDDVIRIIREEDEPKEELKRYFSLTELQAEYVLNMRLRSLRRLEEMEIRKERQNLMAERDDLNALLAVETKRWAHIAQDLKKMERIFSGGIYGPRRTEIAQAPSSIDISRAFEVEKEPLTVLLSEQGWIRAMKGHGFDAETHRFKEGDAAGFIVECQSTDKLALMASGGRAFTLKAGDLPRGRGFGQAVRTMIDLPQDENVIAFFLLSEEEERYLLVSQKGYGLQVLSKNISSEKRTGRPIMKFKTEHDRLMLCMKVEEDAHLLCLNTQKRAVIFPVSDVAEQKQGAGVIFMKMEEGGALKEVRLFNLEDGLIWREGQRARKSDELAQFVGRRGILGKAAAQWMLRK